jgi:hypothetical protein
MISDSAMLVFELFREVQRQAEDQALWCRAETVYEAYIQDALRSLHEKVEALQICHTDQFGGRLS